MLKVRGFHSPAGAQAMEPSVAPVSSKPMSQTQMASLPSTVQISLSPQDFASHGSGHGRRGEVHRESVLHARNIPRLPPRKPWRPVESDQILRTCDPGETSPKSTENNPIVTIHISTAFSRNEQEECLPSTTHGAAPFSEHSSPADWMAP